MSKPAGDAIAAYINTQGLAVDALDVSFDAPKGQVTVAGLVADVVADHVTKEEVILCCGNVAKVAKVEMVNDMLVVNEPEPESLWHVAVSGENLSKIAKHFYDNPNKTPVTFEANQLMLSHPDKIYPGQMLRIPPLV